MSKGLWPCALLTVLLAGCQHDQVVRLDSTRPGRTTYVSRDVAPARTSRGTDLAVHSRRDWATVAPISMRLDPMGKVTRITVHHSGELNEMNSDNQVIEYLRNVQSSQSRPKASGGLGAGDLAYHFIIDRNGVTWEGRSLNYQGAHAGNSDANRGNIGICVLGNFDVQYPNDRQKESLKTLLGRLMDRYSLSGSDIYTHREIRVSYGLASTECPGTRLQPFVNQMRRELKTRSTVTLARNSGR